QALGRGARHQQRRHAAARRVELPGPAGRLRPPRRRRLDAVLGQPGLVQGARRRAAGAVAAVTSRPSGGAGDNAGMNGPQRIVCLTEETTEWLYLLGEEHRIVGISGYTVRPRRARDEKPRVSAFLDGKIDKIVALR